MSVSALLTAQPYTQLKKQPRFYIRYDGVYLLLCLALLAVLQLTGVESVLGEPRLWWLAVAPPLFYVLVVSHLSIHNATHGSFPRSLNRVVGEILGFIVIVRYASWDVVHMRHHKYSDDRQLDPHPNFAGFWKTVLETIVNVEKQLQAQYYEFWGDTAENRRYERVRAWVSYGTNVFLILVWAKFLGPWFFLCVFGPLNIAAGLFVIHFNWSTHNGGRTTDGFRPVNLDHGYYWLGNRIFFGIYYHANHHHRPHLFNPMHWDEAKLGAQEPVVDGVPASLAV